MSGVRRFLALTPGNPMNPATLLLLAFFVVTLVGFPPLVLALGMGWGEVALIEAVVLVAAAACLGLVVWIGRRYASDHARLLAGDCWARWTPTADVRARFLAQDRQRARAEARRYLLYAAGAALLGALAMWVQVRTVAGAAIGLAVFGGAGLLVVVTTWFWGATGANPGGVDPDGVCLAADGIHQFGRYTPVRGFNLFLRRVEFVPGEPAAIAFTVGSRMRGGGVRTTETRVAIPPGHEAEAAALVERYRREFALDG